MKTAEEWKNILDKESDNEYCCNMVQIDQIERIQLDAQAEAYKKAAETIEQSEYEKLIADKARLDWAEKHLVINHLAGRIGIYFSDSGVVLNLDSTLRAAISAAMQNLKAVSDS